MKSLKMKKILTWNYFQKYFNSLSPSQILKGLCNTNDKERNNSVAGMIKSGLSDLKDEIKDV